MPMPIVRRYTREKLPEHWKSLDQVLEAKEDVQVGADCGIGGLRITLQPKQ